MPALSPRLQTSIYLAAFSGSPLGCLAASSNSALPPAQVLIFTPLKGNSILPGAQAKAMGYILDSYFSPTPHSLHAPQEILLVVPSQHVQNQTTVVTLATPTLGGVTKTCHGRGPLTASLFLPLTLVVCSQHSGRSDFYKT